MCDRPAPAFSRNGYALAACGRCIAAVWAERCTASIPSESRSIEGIVPAVPSLADANAVFVVVYCAGGIVGPSPRRAGDGLLDSQ